MDDMEKDDFDERSRDMFHRAVRAFLEEVYDITTEVSGKGKVYERAVRRGKAFELISIGDQVYDFHLN